MLRVQRIEAIPIRVPLPFTYSGSTYRMRNRCTIVTRIHTGAGIVGEAYNADEDSPMHDREPAVARGWPVPPVRPAQALLGPG